MNVIPFRLGCGRQKHCDFSKYLFSSSRLWGKLKLTHGIETVTLKCLCNMPVIVW